MRFAVMGFKNVDIYKAEEDENLKIKFI